MAVRCEIAQTRRETGVWNGGDWLRRLWRCLSHCTWDRMGTGARKKSASLQQDVDRLSVELARRSSASAIVVEASMDYLG